MVYLLFKDLLRKVYWATNNVITTIVTTTNQKNNEKYGNSYLFHTKLLFNNFFH